LTGTTVGPYRVLEKLGAGGMGEVYRARDTRLNRDVALKVLPVDWAGDVDRRTRFQHEAQVLAALNHPNVAAIYGLEEEAGHLALSMELVPGGPLTDRIGPHGISVPQALRFAVQIAAGLEAAHKVGVVHRDLKPANVLVTPTGAVKLVDFGIAKRSAAAFGADSTETSLQPRTDAGTILGTVAYMSPEQARVDSVDGRSDIFSFGALLYEVLTGRRPFAQPDRMSTLADILNRDPAPPSTLNPALPREVERIVLRCLRKDPERRFQTATDLRLELEDVLEDTASQRAAPGSVPRRRAQTLIWAGAGVAAIAAVTALVYSWRSRDDAPRQAAAGALRQLTLAATLALTPALSPDGRLLAYASDAAGEGHLDIWVKQMAGGEPVRVTRTPDSEVNPQFSPDGTSIYFLGARNDLFQVPTFGGTPRRLLPQAGPFSMSNRGDVAFYRPSTGSGPGPVLLLRAGQSAAERWQPDCVSVSAPAWSPDGARLAFVGACAPLPGSLAGANEVFVASMHTGSPAPIGRVPLNGSATRIGWTSFNGAEVIVIPVRAGDSTNIHLLGMDGTLRPLTRGTGREDWPVVSSTGDVVFVRTEQTPSVWSVPLLGDAASPQLEAAPARMFGTSRDGVLLAFGRMLGLERGQLVLRDRQRGTETILATHEVALGGGGSFWPQISPDKGRIAYRVSTGPGSVMFVISSDGAASKRLGPAEQFALASDWLPDGTQLLGECQADRRGVCHFDPERNTARVVATTASGGELLYPSYSWDGRWMAFMLRRDGRTSIAVAPVGRDGTPSGEDRWTIVSDQAGDASRPRFSPDARDLYFLMNQGNVVRLLRQRIDPSTMRPTGPPAVLALVENVPQSVFNLQLQNVVTVTRDRVFFNTSELRSNVWATTLGAP
jgi:Tol biopolymer transport system component